MTMARPVSVPVRAQTVRLLFAIAWFQLDFVRARLFAAFEQLNRMTRHDGGDRVLVDELGMPIPPQQHAEIIEPGHHALQFHPVDQENGERDFALRT